MQLLTSNGFYSHTNQCKKWERKVQGKGEAGMSAHLNLLGLPLAHSLMLDGQQVELSKIDTVPDRALAGAHGR